MPARAKKAPKTLPVKKKRGEDSDSSSSNDVMSSPHKKRFGAVSSLNTGTSPSSSPCTAAAVGADKDFASAATSPTRSPAAIRRDEAENNVVEKEVRNDDQNGSALTLPQRPATAYILFQVDQNLSRRWAGLSAKQYAKYEAMHVADANRYEKAIAEWRDAGGASQHMVPKPKGALTPYMFFAKEQNVDGKWRAASPHVRSLYAARARALLASYSANLAAYEQRFGARALEAPDWPARPLGAYMSFAAQRRAIVKQANPTLNTAQIGQRLGVEWRALPPAQKKRFTDEYERAYERWTRATRAYEAEWGAIKFIKKAREKHAATLQAEQQKHEAQQKREIEREKIREKRAKVRQRAQRMRVALAAQRERARQKKQHQKLVEKALRQGLALYKRENRARLKKRVECRAMSAGELNARIEHDWSQLSIATQRNWARRAARADDGLATVNADGFDRVVETDSGEFADRQADVKVNDVTEDEVEDKDEKEEKEDEEEAAIEEIDENEKSETAPKNSTFASRFVEKKRKRVFQNVASKSAKTTLKRQAKRRK